MPFCGLIWQIHDRFATSLARKVVSSDRSLLTDTSYQPGLPTSFAAEFIAGLPR